MKNTIAIFSVVTVLSGCATGLLDIISADRVGARNGPGRANDTSAALTLDTYKRNVAHRISQMNSTKIYPGRPQVLLRSIVILRYTVDDSGNLLSSAIERSNQDSATEATALETLRNTAPFPKPAPQLLQAGRVEILESWLFNSDGRFQLRSIAKPQSSE